MKKNSLRDIRQSELANTWIERGENGIIYACPRFGKIKVAVLIMEKIKPTSVLIAYPDKKIEQSWKDDFEKWDFDVNATFTTHLSLHKYKDNKYDLVIIDEVHLLSEAQIEACKDLLENNDRVLGLTGTLSRWSENTLREGLGLRVVGRYSIERAIDEGILPDYEIRIVKVPLDNKIVRQWKTKWMTEKKRFDSFMWVINKKEKEDGDVPFFLKLRIIDILMGSLAKMNATIALIKKYENERILVFCGRTEIADKLGIPSYHSKSEDKELWDEFLVGDVNHMAVVKIGNTGITYKPLSKVIINHFDSNSETLTQRVNRCMSMEYDNPDKKAIIYIISSTEQIELRWLSKALSMFEKNKIKYL